MRYEFGKSAATLKAECETTATPKRRPPSHLVPYHRVYIPTGSATHLLAPLDSPNGTAPALCGMRYDEHDSSANGWFGTGSQAEWDRAAAQYICKRCRKAYNEKEGVA